MAFKPKIKISSIEEGEDIKEITDNIYDNIREVKDNKIKEVLEEEFDKSSDLIKRKRLNKKTEDFVERKYDYSKFASSEKTEEENYKKTTEHYTILKTKEFQEIYHSTAKRGSAIYIHLKTGMSIYVAKNKIELIESSNEKTVESDSFKKEISAMIALSFENKMRSIRLEGSDEAIKIAFNEIKRLNSLVKDPTNKIFVLPVGPEQERIFKEVFSNENEVNNEVKFSINSTKENKENETKASNKPKF